MTISKKDATLLQDKIANVETALLALKEKVGTLSKEPVLEIQAKVGEMYKSSAGHDRVVISAGGKYWIIDQDGRDATGAPFKTLQDVTEYMRNTKYTTLDLKS